MSDAEVHLLWARLLPGEKGFTDVVRRQLDEALARDAVSPEVHYRRAIFFIRHSNIEDAGRELDTALAARPDDPRFLLARVAWYERRAKVAGPTSPPPPQELRDRLARTAASAAQLDVAAGFEGFAGHVEAGMALITRALALDPLCWSCQRTRALLLVHAGRVDEALAATDRALSLLPDRASPVALLAFRRKIEQERAAQPGAH